MSASKKKGTAWESACVAYLRENGFGTAERRALAGGADKGDINAGPGLVIECKNTKAVRLSIWVDEANLEARNAGAPVGLVWAHRAGKASPGEGYVVMDGQTALTLLRMAGYGDALEGVA